MRIPNRRYQHLNHADSSNYEEYNNETAIVIARTIAYFNDRMTGMDKNQTFSFIQTYSLKQGLKKFQEQGRAAINKELKQLHDRMVFEPIQVKDLTQIEKKRAMESLIFLTQKRDDTIKARACANGSTQ